MMITWLLKIIRSEPDADARVLRAAKAREELVSRFREEMREW